MNDVAKSMAIEPIRFIRKSSDGPAASLKGSRDRSGNPALHQL